MILRTGRLLGAMVPWIATASLLAGPIGQPTPCPCAADGACVPARATWGYTRTQWRLWPGTTLDDARSGAEPTIGKPQIKPISPPNPTVEDKLAPPKVEALEAESRDEEASADRDFELPELPEREDDDNAEPDRFRPPRPGFMDRPPGSGLFDEPTEPDNGGESDLPFSQPPPAPTETPQPPADLFPNNQQRGPTGPSLGDDAPPAFPFAMQPNTGSAAPARRTTQIVLPATAIAAHSVHTVSRIPVHAAPQRTRQAALNQVGDAPPSMPASFVVPQ